MTHTPLCFPLCSIFRSQFKFSSDSYLLYPTQIHYSFVTQSTKLSQKKVLHVFYYLEEP